MEQNRPDARGSSPAQDTWGRKRNGTIKSAGPAPMKEVGSAQMTDRSELVEAALDMLPNGTAVVSEEGRVVFWNRAAEALTGYGSAAFVGRPAREALEEMVVSGLENLLSQAGAESSTRHHVLLHLRNRQGCDIAAVAQMMVLRDGLGRRIGTVAVFHPTEALDGLPRGECRNGIDVEKSQADLEERIDEVFEEFIQTGVAFGVLWVMVDQAHELRRTHGNRACEAMLEKVECALLNGLHPGEELGRWGDDEFLVLSHEATAELLAVHARRLAGMARTAEFRWWGDRVSLTVSMGAAHAASGETLRQLLERARAAMISSVQEGGNNITLAPGE